MIAIGIISIISISMLVQSILNYNSTKNKLSNEIIYNTNISVNQLKKVLVHYIESYEINEYENVIESEMGYKDIYAIVVEDFKMGKILGKETYVIGKTRDENWNVIEYDSKKTSLNKYTFYSVKNDIVNNDGIKIGTISIYSTDKFTKQELQTIITRNILLTFLISLITIMLLFYVIYISFLKPISIIIDSISNTDQDGVPINKIKISNSSSNEIENLATIINKMILQIKKSTKDLEEQNVELQTIFNNSKDGIAIFDLDTKFLNFNDAYLEITGYSRKELATKTCLELTAPEDIEKAMSVVEKVKEHGVVENFEKTCVGKDGKRVSSIMSIVLLPDKKRMLATTKDMTQFKLLESQAKLASMGEMIGNIAHQWRQPLSVITTSISSLHIKKDLGKKVTNEEIDEIYDLIIKQAKYLSKTIDDFRDFIKGDKNYYDISLKEVIDESLNLAKSSIVNNFINLVYDVEDDTTIYGNKSELEQALINIINNAKDALKENVLLDEDRFIFLSTKKIDNDNFEMKIKDSAGGIPDNIIQRIFEPYFTTKHKAQGTGLGLSMADKILRERHHCVFEVTNETYRYNNKDYKGACFTIIFKSKNNTIS